MKYKTTPLVTSVSHNNDNPVFGESATHIKIEDEAGGPFIILTQCNDHIQPGEVRFDIDELEVIVKEARKMVKRYGWVVQ